MKIIVKKLLKNVRVILLSILAIFCLLEIGCSKRLYQYSVSPEAQHYPVLKYKLIELIGALPKSMPTTLETVQSLFNNQLHFKSENEYFTSYIGGPFITRDNVIITDINIRERKNNKLIVDNIGLGFNQNQCVNTELLKKKFGFHNLQAYVAEPVEHPPISYAIDLNKERSFSVGTTLDNEGCATYIVSNMP